MNTPKDILPTIDTPPALSGTIIARIHTLENRRARRELGLLGVSTLTFGALLIPAVEYAWNELYASTLYEMLSLLFSDGSLIFSHTQTFGLALLESFPSFALLLVLLSSVGLGWSLYRMVEHIPQVRARIQRI